MSDTPKQQIDRIKHDCECGSTIKCTITHYARVSCRKCGMIFWALQPNRGGMLQLFKWPGCGKTPQQETEQQ